MSEKREIDTFFPSQPVFVRKMKEKTYFYALIGRFDQLNVDYIPRQPRSHAVARIADSTASQQTVYKLAIVAK